MQTATDDHYKTVIGWNMETKVGPLSPWQWVSLCFLLGDKNDLAIDGKVLPSASPINGTVVDFTVGTWLPSCWEWYLRKCWVLKKRTDIRFNKGYEYWKITECWEEKKLNVGKVLNTEWKKLLSCTEILNAKMFRVYIFIFYLIISPDCIQPVCEFAGLVLRRQRHGPAFRRQSHHPPGVRTEAERRGGKADSLALDTSYTSFLMKSTLIRRISFTVSRRW